MYKFLIFGLILGQFVNCCNISIRIINQSNEQYFVQVQTPSGQKSPQFLLKSMGSEASYNFGEPICTANTIISVYGSDEGGQNATNLISTSSAILDGVGQIEYLVQVGGQISVGARIGVTCALGDCKSGR